MTSSFVGTLAGRRFARGSSDATGTAAKFALPSALALDGGSGETLYVIDSSALTGQRLRAVTIASGAVRTVTGAAAGAAGGFADGLAAAAAFAFGTPDSGVSNAPGSSFAEVVGWPNPFTVNRANGDDTGGIEPGTMVVFGMSGAAFDPTTGNILLADSGNNRVRRINALLPSPPPAPPTPPSPPPSPPAPPLTAGSAFVRTAADLTAALSDTTVSRIVLVGSLTAAAPTAVPSSSAAAGSGGGSSRRELIADGAPPPLLLIDRVGEDITIEGGPCSVPPPPAAPGCPAAPCATLDAAAASRAVAVANARSLTLRNLVIANGTDAGGGGGGGGGCVFAPGTPVVLDNVVFNGCSATGVRILPPFLLVPV